MSNKNTKEMAKDIVMHCFRNTHLENIHAGEKNGGVGDGFGDIEMKKLMIEAVNNVYTWLTVMEQGSEYQFRNSQWKWITMYRSCHKDWNEPKLVKNLIEKKKK